MDVQAMEQSLCTCRIEILIFDFSDGAAVHGIGIVRTKAWHVEQIRSPANLLIGGKPNLHSGMLSSRRNQALGHSKDLCNAGFVVRPQQSGTIGDNQVLAPASVQNGIVRLPQINLPLFVQKDVFSVIGNDFRPDVCAGGIRCGIHMGNQPNGGQAWLPGNGAVNITVGVHMGIPDSHLEHFLHQGLPQALLLLGRRAGLGIFVGLGIK